MTRYAVGDLQGWLTPLQKLLDRVGFRPGVDQLWCVGDLVNRGPESLDALRFVKNLGDSARVVLGNHDLHLLAVAAGVKREKRSDTLSQILASEDCEELLEWLARQPLVWRSEDRTFTLVHAGLPPQWTAAKAERLAAEVSAALTSDRRTEFLAAMYGNEPECWDDNLTGFDRLRVITNYLTRMRFVRANGSLDLVSKGTPEDAPTGYMPWFEVPAAQWRHDAGTVIFGHWAALNGAVDDSQLLALDTGYVWGNHLTLVDVDSGEQWTEQAEQ